MTFSSTSLEASLCSFLSAGFIDQFFYPDGQWLTDSMILQEALFQMRLLHCFPHDELNLLTLKQISLRVFYKADHFLRDLTIIKTGFIKA